MPLRFHSNVILNTALMRGFERGPKQSAGQRARLRFGNQESNAGATLIRRPGLLQSAGVAGFPSISGR
jgi:hypothetical protein